MAVKKLAESVRSKKASPVVEKKGTKKAGVVKKAFVPAAKAAATPKRTAVKDGEVAAPRSISAPKSVAVNAARRASKGEARKARNAANVKSVNEVKEKGPSDIIYIGHIPAGFEEREMRKFFSQFGDVVRLKLARNKKTMGSRGHAFVKFESAATATTVSEAMNGYFIGERQLVSHVVPKSKVHEGLLRTGPRGSSTSGGNRGGVETGGGDSGDEDASYKRSASESTFETAKAAAAMRKKQKKLKELGIEYEFLDALKQSSASIDKATAKKAAAPIPVEPAFGEDEEASKPATKKAAAASKKSDVGAKKGK